MFKISEVVGKRIWTLEKSFIFGSDVFRGSSIYTVSIVAISDEKRSEEYGHIK